MCHALGGIALGEKGRGGFRDTKAAALLKLTPRVHRKPLVLLVKVVTRYIRGSPVS